MYAQIHTGIYAENPHSAPGTSLTKLTKSTARLRRGGDASRPHPEDFDDVDDDDDDDGDDDADLI